MYFILWFPFTFRFPSSENEMKSKTGKSDEESENESKIFSEISILAQCWSSSRVRWSQKRLAHAANYTHIMWGLKQVWGLWHDLWHSADFIEIVSFFRETILIFVDVWPRISLLSEGKSIKSLQQIDRRSSQEWKTVLWWSKEDWIRAENSIRRLCTGTDSVDRARRWEEKSDIVSSLRAHQRRLSNVWWIKSCRLERIAGGMKGQGICRWQLMSR